MQKNKQRGSAIAMVIGPITKTKDKGPCKCYHEVSFRSISNDDPYNVGSIRFRNYYCASLKIKQLYKDEATGKDRWRTVLNEKKLMQDPHYEDDAQAWHTVHISDFNKNNFIQDVNYPFRFYVSQPSPHWRRFELREVMFFEKSKEDKLQKRRKSSSNILHNSLRGNINNNNNNNSSYNKDSRNNQKNSATSSGSVSGMHGDNNNNLVFLSGDPGIRRLLALEVKSQNLSNMVTEFATSGDSRNNPISCLSFENGDMSSVAIETPVLPNSNNDGRAYK